MELRDKVAIVTGGTSGIGKAIATRFVEEGARLVVIGTAETEGRSLESTLRIRARERNAGDCLFVQADVSRADEVRAAVESAVSRWDRIDVIVNNAATMKTGRVVDTDEADWDRTMAVNVKGAFLVCKHALPHMGPKGTIVMISSVHAVATDADSAAYTASKGALEALTVRSRSSVSSSRSGSTRSGPAPSTRRCSGKTPTFGPGAKRFIPWKSVAQTRSPKWPCSWPANALRSFRARY